MIQLIRIIHLTLSGWLLLPFLANAQTIMTAGVPAQLDIRAAGEASIRITLKPLSYKENFPYTPAVVEKTISANFHQPAHPGETPEKEGG